MVLCLLNSSWCYDFLKFTAKRILLIASHSRKYLLFVLALKSYPPVLRAHSWVWLGSGNQSMWWMLILKTKPVLCKASNLPIVLSLWLLYHKFKRKFIILLTDQLTILTVAGLEMSRLRSISYLREFPLALWKVVFCEPI